MPWATRRSAASIVLLFMANGLVVGAWGGTLAVAADRLALGRSWQVPTVLLTMGLSCLVHMAAAGRLSDRYGARAVALTGLAVLAVGCVLAAFAVSLPLLLVAAAVLGAGSGLIDVPMNALGVLVSDASARPLFNFFHGSWSIGQFTGALLVMALGAAGITGAANIVAVMLSLAVLLVAAWWVAFRTVPGATIPAHAGLAPGQPLPRSIWLLGFAALGFGIGEGTAMDWAGIHTHETTGLTPAVAAVGLAAMAGAMVLVRLCGDPLVARWGPRATVRGGALVCSLGYVGVSLGHHLAIVLPSWLLVGLGVGMIAPQVYAAAGRLGGARGLSVTVSVGYVSVLAGPALIGWLRHTVGMSAAMWLPAVAVALVVPIAVVIPRQASART